MRMLASLDGLPSEVRESADLDNLDGLIIPGGESTTITKAIERDGLAEPIRSLAARGRPVLGTC
ncbi:MAG: pyridoxal 5'-phosphate synthase glutaminase subunit PdxT, partial [Solirubrobacterales bacterium]